MHYTTVTVGLVAGHEAQDIDDAIAQGLEALSKEINGPVELVNVVPIRLPSFPTSSMCLTIMAKPYQPPIMVTNGTSMEDAMRQLLRMRL